jgi:hypothetical protein
MWPLSKAPTWISHATSPSQSQWNNFRIIYGNYRIVVDFTVVISSKKLGLIQLNPLHLSRLELMENQYRDGNSYQQISDYLNSNGFRKTLTNGLYRRKDVCMSLLKYRRRLSRNTQSTVLNVVESLVLIPLKISQNHNLN